MGSNALDRTLESKVLSKCAPSPQHYEDFKTTNDFQETQSLDCVASINSLNKHTKVIYASSKSLDEIQLCKSSARMELSNLCKGNSDNELRKTPSGLSNLANTLNKSCEMIFKSDGLTNYKELDNFHNASNIPVTLSSSRSEHVQGNVAECLLDLDNYLANIDKDCYMTAASDLNLNIFPQKNNGFEINSSFKRRSVLRNTVDCTYYKPKAVTQHDISVIYGKWNNGLNKPNELQEENKNSSIERTSSSYLCTMTSKSDEDNENKNYNNFQVLTNDQIFQNLIENGPNIEGDRPRQLGRRAERLSNTIQNYSYPNYGNCRPMSAPMSNNIEEVSHQNELLYSVSDGNSRTPVLIESSTESGEPLVTVNTAGVEQNSFVNEENEQHSSQEMNDDIHVSIKSDFNINWPHSCSRTMALISCTLGLFNINRFAILAINYGGNFLIQFLLLSIIFGIPFLWLQMSLGAKIRAGPILMWKISPICIGIGISITLVQCFITVYSSIAIAWLLVYIKDIFINKSSYPWTESIYPIVNREFASVSGNLSEGIPDYFNVNVLQRKHLLKIADENKEPLHMNERLAFYLAFLWAVVFLILCKGLKSFGKFIFVLTILPIALLAAIAVKLLWIVDIVKLQNIFGASDFDDFLANSKTWTAAAQEAFLTWGLLGASTIAISSRQHKNSSKLTLRRDAIIVALVTLVGLFLSSIVGLCLIQLLTESGYIYVPSSYETPKHYSAIFYMKSLTSSELISYPIELVPHYSALVGEVYRRHTHDTNVSGYQALRFVTEILPAATAISIKKFSWIWTAIIFIVLLLFGLCQLCVMWKPISCALGNSSSAVLISCVTGLLLSIPFATEIGITLLHYMDLLLGGAWFIPVLWSVEIFGVFLIRGRPYNGDDLVNDLKIAGSMSAFLALSWNILLPIGLITLAIIEYKISWSYQLYYFRGKGYFNDWSRKVGALTQIGFLILIPVSAIIQIWRYLSSGPPDILDRIQMLYRPLEDAEGIRENEINRSFNPRYNHSNSTIGRFRIDSPPKYTPPPSYTTATGARLAKALRQSLRRSMRRLLGESECSRANLFAQNRTEGEQTSNPLNDLLVLTPESSNESFPLENRALNISHGRSLSLGRTQTFGKRCLQLSNEQPSSIQPIHSDSNSNERSARKCSTIEYTAEDVITILKSCTLRRKRMIGSTRLHSETTCSSVENLVHNSEPPSLSSAIIEQNASTAI